MADQHEQNAHNQINTKYHCINLILEKYSKNLLISQKAPELKKIIDNLIKKCLINISNFMYKKIKKKLFSIILRDSL